MPKLLCKQVVYVYRQKGTDQKLRERCEGNEKQKPWLVLIVRTCLLSSCIYVRVCMYTHVYFFLFLGHECLILPMENPHVMLKIQFKLPVSRNKKERQSFRWACGYSGPALVHISRHWSALGLLQKHQDIVFFPTKNFSVVAMGKQLSCK